jgi:YNFM family putative membrane transporter
VVGLLNFTAGFFGAHSVASGWIPMLAIGGRAQAASLYNLAYYSGSSVFGWALGFAFNAGNWAGLVLAVLCLLVCAAVLALLGLRRGPVSGPGSAPSSLPSS